MLGDYNKKGRHLAGRPLGVGTLKPYDWVFCQDFFAGLTIASGLVVLGGLTAVAAGECAPAASIGLPCAEAAAAGAATV